LALDACPAQFLNAAIMSLAAQTLA